MEVSDAVHGLAGQSPTDADVDGCRRALTALMVVARWVDVQRLAWHTQLQHLADATPTILPEEINATATGRSLRAGITDSTRTTTLAACPPVRDLFTTGTTSVEHIDALSAIANGLEPPQRSKLLADPTISQLAARSTANEFRVGLRRLARRIQDDDGIARARQQRRENAFRSWVDRTSGMVCFRGQLDPETGNRFLQRIECKVEDLFHDQTPDNCPTDAVAKQAHLRALALVALTDAKHGHAGVTEVIVVIDADTVHHGRHEHSDVRFQADVDDVPVESVRRMLCTGVVTPIMIRDGVVLSVGRTQRLATRAQRRALRVMYPTCAIPGCNVAFDHCTPHHVHWWRHGGSTDLHNLLPLCTKHHQVHDHHWTVNLIPGTRQLIVTRPDGTTMTTGPPTARAG